MIKAIFVDFYGTLVHEDGEVVEKISQIIFDTGNAASTSEVASFWWKDFQERFMKAYGENFETQRALEEKSLQQTIEHFESTADAKALSEEMFAHWVKPPIFEDTKPFFEECTLPIYIVSNIDREDVLQAIAYHGLSPAGVFTSEDARSYKPRKELFEFALRETGLRADEVVHIGDSMSSDVKGAGSLGIRAIWLNRFGKEVPEGVACITKLTECVKKNRPFWHKED